MGSVAFGVFFSLFGGGVGIGLEQDDFNYHT
jgi:hypothetical protein